MTFLAPLAGIIAGAVAAPLLALLYFLRLRRRPVRVSSVMLWSQAVRDLQVNAPFQWIRPSWLLLLQMLALACFALAAARPAIRAEAGQAARLIIMIDRSASMAAPGADAENPDATRLDLAKRRALEVVERLETGGLSGVGAAQAAVISFAADARLLADFTGDPSLLRAPLEAVEPTDQPASFDEALRLAGALAASAGVEEGVRVVLLSDGAIDAEPRAIAALKNADFRFVRTGPPPDAERDNRGVVSLSAQRDYDEPALVRLFARLLNTRVEPVETTLTVFVDGEPRRAVAVNLPAATTEGPGEAAATAQWRSTATGAPSRVVVSIPGSDALEADDRAALLLAPAPRPRALVVAPAERSAAANLAHAMLMRALAATEPTRLDEVGPADYSALLAGGRMADSYDLVVFDDVAPEAPPPLPSLSFGAGLPSLGVRVVEASGAGDGGEAPPTTRFVSWRRVDAAMRHVSLDSVIIRGAPVVIAEPGEGAPEVETLAQAEPGPLIVRVTERGRRRLVAGLSLARSNWPVQAGFAIFIANAVENLTTAGGVGAGRFWTTDQPVVLTPAPNARRVRITGPVERTVEAAPGASTVSLGVLPRVGVYEAQGVVERDRVFAVNLLDERESALATANAVRLPSGDAPATSLAATQPREIWQWFVLAGLALLTVEWLLYAARMRV